MKLLRYVLLTMLVLSLAAVTGWADDDPPGRVARLQYVDGSVSIQPRGTDDWVAGVINRPLTNADNVWTDKDSRAELNVGGGYLRMSGETSLTLTNVSDNTVQVQLHQGTLNLAVRKLYGGQIYEVDTPNIAFTVQKSGEYRFDVGPDGDATLVTVWKGAGDATGDGPAVRVQAHQRARFTGGTSLAHEISAAPNYDGFDDWCQVRDKRLDGSYSARYVAPGTIGYEDLDNYGSWRVVPTYGSIWVPASVAPGWAPYRYGHWVWVSPWGWTWVDDSPWGFAPYHYGRWVYYGGYWGWAPGPVYVRPVYAPALVAWFGGPGWGVSFGFGGGYGWCPLGFGEPFFPWYGGSPRYFRNVNITNTRITNITYITNNYYNGRGPRSTWPGHFRNLNAPGGMTAVSQRTIVNSLPVAKAMVPVSPRQVKQFSSTPLGTKLGLEPTRESRLGATTGRPAATPPQRATSRPVISRLAPPSTGSRPGGTETASLLKPDRAIADAPGRQRPASPAAPGRFVPRPPQATDATERHALSARNNAPSPTAGNSHEARPGAPRTDASGGGARINVPRPPAPGSENHAAPSTPTRSVPRPPEGNRMAPGEPSARSTPGASPHEAPAPRQPVAMPKSPAGGGAIPRGNGNERPSSGRPDSAPQSAPRPQPGSVHGSSTHGSSTPGSGPSAHGSTRFVPRPTGPVMAANYAPAMSDFRARSGSTYSVPRPPEGRSAPRSYGDSSRYSAPAPNRSMSSYGSAPSSRGPAAPSYHGSPYQGSPSRGSSYYGSPSQGSSSHGSSTHSSPSYGSPSHGSSHSYQGPSSGSSSGGHSSHRG